MNEQTTNENTLRMVVNDAERLWSRLRPLVADTNIHASRRGMAQGVTAGEADACRVATNEAQAEFDRLQDALHGLSGMAAGELVTASNILAGCRETLQLIHTNMKEASCE